MDAKQSFPQPTTAPPPAPIFEGWSSSRDLERRASRVGLFGHAAFVRDAEATTDWANGIGVIVQLVARDLAEQGFEDCRPILSPADTEGLLRLAAMTARLVADHAEETHAWVDARVCEIEAAEAVRAVPPHAPAPSPPAAAAEALRDLLDKLGRHPDATAIVQGVVADAHRQADELVHALGGRPEPRPTVG